ncbi:MAG: hypothetical protein P8Y97_23245, partial [Candidatus Lokiarchaeota archaeon]
MKKRSKIILISLVILSLFSIVIISPISHKNIPNQNQSQSQAYDPQISNNDNNTLLVTGLTRSIYISAYGLVRTLDVIDFVNYKNNPVSVFKIGIPVGKFDNLVYSYAEGSEKNSLLIQKSNKKEITVTLIYKDLLEFTPSSDTSYVTYIGNVFPNLPYYMKGIINTRAYPVYFDSIEAYDWGEKAGNDILYSFNKIQEDNTNITEIAPFATNIEDYQSVTIGIKVTGTTWLEFQDISRNVIISPWGTIKVKTHYIIKNKGVLTMNQFSLNLPTSAEGIHVYDYLGNITGTSVGADNKLTINLRNNRPVLSPGGVYSFNVEYHLPFEKYVTYNWFQQTIKLNPLFSNFEFLGNNQTINIFIESGSKIDFMTETPDSITNANGQLQLSYHTEYVTQFNKQNILITYNINLFSFLFRPLILILIIAIISSLSVILIKRRKKSEIQYLEKRKLPEREIKEFCSLYDEKNALIFEMRNAEFAMKRRKMNK